MYPCKLHGNLWTTQDNLYSKYDKTYFEQPKYTHLDTHFITMRYNYISTYFLGVHSAQTFPIHQHRNVRKKITFFHHSNHISCQIIPDIYSLGENISHVKNSNKNKTEIEMTPYNEKYLEIKQLHVMKPLNKKKIEINESS